MCTREAVSLVQADTAIPTKPPRTERLPPGDHSRAQQRGFVVHDDSRKLGAHFGNRPGIAVDLVRKANRSGLGGIDEEHSTAIAEENPFGNPLYRESQDIAVK
jgi:hypothetical protein